VGDGSLYIVGLGGKGLEEDAAGDEVNVLFAEKDGLKNPVTKTLLGTISPSNLLLSNKGCREMEKHIPCACKSSSSPHL